MTGFDPPDYRALADRISEVTRPPRYELRCGPGVAMWLKLTTAEPASPRSGVIGALTGAPMIDSPELGRGDWELCEDDLAVTSGHIDIPEFVTRPIELTIDPLPNLADRLNWRLAGMVMPPPSFAIGLGGL